MGVSRGAAPAIVGNLIERQVEVSVLIAACGTSRLSRAAYDSLRKRSRCTEPSAADGVQPQPLQSPGLLLTVPTAHMAAALNRIVSMSPPAAVCNTAAAAKEFDQVLSVSWWTSSRTLKATGTLQTAVIKGRLLRHIVLVLWGCRLSSPLTRHLGMQIIIQAVLMGCRAASKELRKHNPLDSEP